MYYGTAEVDINGTLYTISDVSVNITYAPKLRLGRTKSSRRKTVKGSNITDMTFTINFDDSRFKNGILPDEEVNELNFPNTSLPVSLTLFHLSGSEPRDFTVSGIMHQVSETDLIASNTQSTWILTVPT